MSQPWAASLPKTQCAHLAPLRLLPGIELCEQAELVWLRGDDLETVDGRLRRLPNACRYRRLADGQLVGVDQRVPTGTLPEGAWTPLGSWLCCVLPPTCWPGPEPNRVRLRLVRTSAPVEPNLLLLTCHVWSEYVETAPQVRLERLAFALDSSGRVLVRGRPLPPLAGPRFVEHEGIAVPVGWRWDPAVDAASLRMLFGLEADNEQNFSELILFNSVDCDWELVPADGFVQATRSAVRLSVEAADGGP